MTFLQFTLDSEYFCNRPTLSPFPSVTLEAFIEFQRSVLRTRRAIVNKRRPSTSRAWAGSELTLRSRISLRRRTWFRNIHAFAARSSSSPKSSIDWHRRKARTIWPASTSRSFNCRSSWRTAWLTRTQLQRLLCNNRSYWRTSASASQISPRAQRTEAPAAADHTTSTCNWSNPTRRNLLHWWTKGWRGSKSWWDRLS